MKKEKKFFKPPKHFQKKAVNLLREIFLEAGPGKPPVREILVSPTGTGKTLMGAHLCGYWKDGELLPLPNILCVGHTIEILSQMNEVLTELFGHNHGAVLRSAQSYKTDFTKKHWSIILVDECHHYVAPVYKNIFKRNTADIILGLTATTQRRDGSPMSDMYDHIVEASSYKEALKRKNLVPILCVVPTREDLHKVGKDENGNIWAPVSPIESLKKISFAKRWKDGKEEDYTKKTLIYVPTCRNAKELAEECSKAGIKGVEDISGKTKKGKRKSLLDEFKKDDGTVNVLINVNIFSEGVNLPNLEVIMLYKMIGARSLLAYRQITGRVARPYPGKKYGILVDPFGVSIKTKLGSPNGNLKSSLEGITVEDLERYNQYQEENKGKDNSQSYDDINGSGGETFYLEGSFLVWNKPDFEEDGEEALLAWKENNLKLLEEEAERKPGWSDKKKETWKQKEWQEILGDKTAVVPKREKVVSGRVNPIKNSIPAERFKDPEEIRTEKALKVVTPLRLFSSLLLEKHCDIGEGGMKSLMRSLTKPLNREGFTCVKQFTLNRYKANAKWVSIWARKGVSKDEIEELIAQIRMENPTE